MLIRNDMLGCAGAMATALLMGSTSYAAILLVPSQFGDIQSAIDAASTGDEVVIAPGSYFGGISFGGKAITVRGQNPRDPATVAATVIYASSADAAVWIASEEGPDSVLSGLTLTGGHSWGGGIYTYFSSPTIINCRCFDNGGAGLTNEFSSPYVVNCDFSDNDRGVYNYFATPTITNCVIARNFDGGMKNASSDAMVVSCIFDENTGGLGAGADNDFTSASTFIDCTFTGNVCDGSGGGMLNDGDTTIVGCTFIDNVASFGSAMANSWRAEVTIADSSFCGSGPTPIEGPWINKGGNTINVVCGLVGDLDGDGGVDSADLALLLGQWGFPGDADLNGDGTVDAADLALLLGNWG